MAMKSEGMKLEVILKIKDSSIRMSLEELRGLHDLLHKLLGEEKRVIEFIPTPVYPVVVQPYVPYWRQYEVWCSNNTKLVGTIMEAGYGTSSTDGPASQITSS